MIGLLPVGTAAAFGAVGEAQSGYLVEAGGVAVMIDMGSGALAALACHRPPEDIDLVVITHMHADHCVDLMGLRVHMRWGPGAGRAMPVLAPPDLPARLGAFSGEAPWGAGEGLAFEAFPAGAGRREIAPGVVLSHAEVPHLPPTHAVRIDHDGASLCFGADCAPSDALVELAHGCDVLMLECAFGPDPVPAGVPHLNADAAGALARRSAAGRLLLTHCQGGHDRDAALARARDAFGGPVDWARPGERVVAG